jgi:hypothetical protein
MSRFRRTETVPPAIPPSTARGASSSMTPALQAAYEAAEYEVSLANERTLVLRHGQRHPDLDFYVHSHHHGVISWAFVTAWNPRSVLLDKSINEQRHDDLKAWVARRGWPFLPGRGRNEDATWIEESLLLMGASRAEACMLGSQFQQHAVLVGDVGGLARICLCDAPTSSE